MMLFQVDQLAQAMAAGTGPASPMGMIGTQAGQVVNQFIGVGNTLLQLGFVVLMTIEVYKVVRGEPADFFTPAIKILIASLVLNSLVPIGTWVGEIAQGFVGAQFESDIRSHGLVTFAKVFELMKMVKSGEGFTAEGMLEIAMSPSGIVFLFAVVVTVLVIAVKYVLIDIVWAVLFIVVIASGALAIPAGVLPGSKSFGGWIRNMIEVALWPVVFHLLILLMISTQTDTIKEIQSLNLESVWDSVEGSWAIWLVLKAMAINIAFGVIVVMTPMICRMIVRSESAGAAGTLTAGMGLAAMTMVLTKVERAGGTRVRNFREKYLGGGRKGSVVSAAMNHASNSTRDARPSS